MKIIHRNKCEHFKNSDSCDAFEYGLGDGEMSGVRVVVRGRYPERGWAANLECKELVYILSGKGKLAVEREERDFGAGDLLLLQRGEKYRWEGDFEAFLCSAPAWHPKQYKLINE